MANKKVKDNDDIFNELAKMDGELVVNSIPVPYYIDTGNLAMNHTCSGRFIGGGIPGGRITEFYGPSGSAKSLWGMTVLAGVQKMGGYAILLDCENALNTDFAARAAHIDIRRLVRYTPVTLESCYRKINAVIKKIREVKGMEPPICILWDSISVPPIEREYKETDLPETYTKEKFKTVVGAREQPGERAKTNSSWLRKINPILEKNNATLLVINQTRSKVGILFGSPETTPGGMALEFYAACRVRTSAQKKILNDELKKPLGVNMKISNKKNRDNTPFLEVPADSAEGGIPLYFDRGIDPLGGSLRALIQAERVEPKGSGNYQIKEPWADGREIKFKAAMTRNSVPMELLMDCPAVVDAKDAEQVANYFKEFDAAIALTNSDTTVEVEVKEEE